MGAVVTLTNHYEDGPHVEQQHDSVTGWHTDERENLHLTNDGQGVVASYARGEWSSVRQDSP